MTEYRFKTEEEFEYEFGEHWREEVPNSWYSGDEDSTPEETMDKQFGKIVPEEYQNIVRAGGGWRDTDYAYSNEMFILIGTTYNTIAMADGASRTFNGLHSCNT